MYINIIIKEIQKNHNDFAKKIIMPNKENIDKIYNNIRLN